MIQHIINTVFAVGLGVFFVWQWKKTPTYTPPVVTDTRPEFYIDRNSQLHINISPPSLITTENLYGKHTVTAEDTEKVAVLLLPIARKVLARSGVTECS